MDFLSNILHSKEKVQALHEAKEVVTAVGESKENVQATHEAKEVVTAVGESKLNMRPKRLFLLYMCQTPKRSLQL